MDGQGYFVKTVKTLNREKKIPHLFRFAKAGFVASPQDKAQAP
jgi:hypothetical protein